MLEPNDQFPDLWITACNSAPITWSRRRIIRLEARFTTTFYKISKNISGLHVPNNLQVLIGSENISKGARINLDDIEMMRKEAYARTLKQKEFVKNSKALKTNKNK